MRSKLITPLILLLFLPVIGMAKDLFPDGTPVPEWFSDTKPISQDQLGKTYVITQHGVENDSNKVQTAAIQAVIDQAAKNGGGVVTIPEGTFLSGSLFFRPNTHLHILRGGKLKGSNDICDFTLMDTRFEGQNVKYFAALVNADHADGFTLWGEGTIDGNGLDYWKHFWLRRTMNPQCTNMDEMRPRLVFISHSKDVRIEGLTLQNSPVWTTHLYQCERVKLLHLRITSPASPVKAPSTDAIDIDACRQVLVKSCFMSVNDDAIALKGGKGPWADQNPDNGANENIIIEDCEYGFCHSCLTCGSESIHNKNIILRRSTIHQADRLLWLKMRPDTPQNYEHILVENIQGDANSCLFIHPWMQFFDLKGRTDMPKSYGRNVTLRHLNIQCKQLLNVKSNPEQYTLENFRFENLNIQAINTHNNPDLLPGSVWKKVSIQPLPQGELNRLRERQISTEEG